MFSIFLTPSSHNFTDLMLHRSARLRPAGLLGEYMSAGRTMCGIPVVLLTQQFLGGYSLHK